MSQHREQSQVGRFTPRPHFIVITIAQHAHYKAESEAACRVNVLKLVSPNQPDSQQLWGQLGLGLGLGLGGISFLKTDETLLSESTKGRTRHMGRHGLLVSVLVLGLGLGLVLVLVFGLGLGLGLGWGPGCLNIENNPRWVISPPGPTLLC